MDYLSNLFTSFKSNTVVTAVRDMWLQQHFSPPPLPPPPPSTGLRWGNGSFFFKCPRGGAFDTVIVIIVRKSLLMMSHSLIASRALNNSQSQNIFPHIPLHLSSQFSPLSDQICNRVVAMLLLYMS